LHGNISTLPRHYVTINIPNFKVRYMRILFACILLLIPFVGNCQLRFKRFPAKFGDTEIVIQRSSDKEIMRFTDAHPDAAFVFSILPLQRSLDICHTQYNKHERLCCIETCEMHLGKIYSLDASVDLSYYRKELQLYRDYQNAYDAPRLKREQKTNDSIRFVSSEQLRIKDSTKRAEDSTLRAEGKERQRIAELESRQQDSIFHIEEAARIRHDKAMYTKKYGARITSLIMNQHVVLGMTKDMCLAAWGEPGARNTALVKGTVVETWVYSLGQYLIFRNGKVVMINE